MSKKEYVEIKTEEVPEALGLYHNLVKQRKLKSALDEVNSAIETETSHIESYLESDFDIDIDLVRKEKAVALKLDVETEVGTPIIVLPKFRKMLDVDVEKWLKAVGVSDKCIEELEATGALDAMSLSVAAARKVNAKALEQATIGEDFAITKPKLEGV